MPIVPIDDDDERDLDDDELDDDDDFDEPETCHHGVPYQDDCLACELETDEEQAGGGEENDG